MDLDAIERIARTVLYEGYLLYPYRPSSVKNRRRWTYGVVYPQGFGPAHGGYDASEMRTECLVRTGVETSLDVRVRFLQRQDRVVAAVGGESPRDPERGPLDLLDVDGRTYSAGEEAVERELTLTGIGLETLVGGRVICRERFEARFRTELIRAGDGGVAGRLDRRVAEIRAGFEVRSERAANGVLRVSVRIANETPLEDPASPERDDALARSLVSTHTILTVRNGEFVSLMDPPGDLREAAAQCRNEGTWPVLVGREDESDAMLSSPIILYDYPEIAPESPGDLFDGTEIDEILTLRILTLTDAEKEEMRRFDDRGRRLLERTESLPREHLARLHGAVRSLRPLGGGEDRIRPEDEDGQAGVASSRG